MLHEDLEDIIARAPQSRQHASAVGVVENWQRARRQLCEAFAAANDARDGRREGHSRDAAFYASMIAREMRLSEAMQERVELAALLHGLGKIALPDAILQKNAPLSPPELEQVRHAAAHGANLINSVEGLGEVALIVRHQGERFDGEGYPDKLMEEEIPLGSRILAIALRFAAMTRPRADRPALSVVGGALEFLAYEAGAALDPNVVRAFLAAMGREDSQDEYSQREQAQQEQAQQEQAQREQAQHEQT